MKTGVLQLLTVDYQFPKGYTLSLYRAESNFTKELQFTPLWLLGPII